MAKLAVLAAFFIALIAGATAYTVTTTVVSEDNPRQSCQREVQEKQHQMMQCRQWMQKGSPFLRSAVANPGRFEEQQLEECCDELRMFSPECRCEALEKMMETMKEEYGREEEMMRMKMKAQSLPSRCRMTSPTHCSFRSPFY